MKVKFLMRDEMCGRIAHHCMIIAWNLTRNGFYACMDANRARLRYRSEN